MKCPSWLNWSYHIPPENKRELGKVVLTFAAFFWLSYHYETPLAWAAAGIMVALDIVIAFVSIATMRENKLLNRAILDSIAAIKDCYKMLECAEFNLHIAMGQLAKLGYTFQRQQLPKDPKDDAAKLRKHLARALAELEKHGVEFNLLDGEMEFSKEPAE